MTLSPVSSGDPHVPAHNAERDAINDLQEQVDARIPLPNNPQVGDQLVWGGSAWVPAATRYFEGTGSPEGAIAAPIGSRYRDLNGTNGGVEWTKLTGTSNTGWMIIAGDTGWRNISTMIALRTTAVVNAAVLRRVNNIVDLYLDITMPKNAASPYVLFTLPTGFRPSFDRHGALQDNKELAATNTLVASNGEVSLFGITAEKRDRWNGQWLTSQAWPAALPGS